MSIEAPETPETVVEPAVTVKGRFWTWQRRIGAGGLAAMLAAGGTFLGVHISHHSAEGSDTVVNFAAAAPTAHQTCVQQLFDTAKVIMVDGQAGVNNEMYVAGVNDKIYQLALGSIVADWTGAMSQQGYSAANTMINREIAEVCTSNGDPTRGVQDPYVDNNDNVIG